MSRPLLALILLAALSAPPVHADGCLLPKVAAADIAEPEQKAVVVFDDGREDLILQVRYSGNPAEFGWLVPLPARPAVTVASTRTFEWLSRGTQKPQLAASDRVARVLNGRRRRSISMRSLGVEVLRRDTLGVYDTVTLAADRGEALQAWLAEHDFRAPSGAGPVLDDYARRHWYFVALRIVPARQDSATAAQLAGGTLQAMRFQFDSVRPVFPLKISALNGSPTEVLIYTVARQQLVAEGGGPVAWQALHCGPGSGGIILPPDRFPRLSRGEAVVSRLRATFRPEQMDDLTFVPYDPRPDLGARDAETRAMAASCAGRQGDAACLPGLLRILKSTWWPGTDAVPALWALGQLGGPEATECLLRWADGSSTLHRVEAFEALARLKEKRALPLYLAALRRWAEPNVLDPWGAEETKAALEHVIALGDEGCRPGLDEIGARRAKPAAWEKECDARPAIGILAAQAACGDAAARDLIVRAIVRQGRELTAPAALVAEAERGGSINGYPTGFWTGYQILRAEGNRRWHALDFALDYLAARPEVLDPLLRRAAADAELPDAGRIVALSALRAAETADLDSLEALWRRALCPGAPMAMIPVEAGFGAPPARVRFNLNASSAAYAFARLRACARLERLWRECPADDRVLRGEIALAAARTDSARLAPIVLEYVTRDWNAEARTGNAERRLAPLRSAHGDSLFVPLRDTALFDFVYRLGPILGFARSALPVVDRIALMSDPRLDPLLRLYWIANLDLGGPDGEALRAAALEACRALATEKSCSPFARTLARNELTRPARMKPFVADGDALEP